MAALVSVTALAAACSGSSPAPVVTAFPGAAAPSGAWPYPNGAIADTRDAPDSAISAANVSSLREAWAFKLAGTAAAGVSVIGSLTAPPVVQHGVVYLQDEDANVYALTLATGKLRWECQVYLPEKSGPGPDGVAVAGGTVYGDTSTSVFALSAATGKTIWVDGNLLNGGPGGVRDPAAGRGRAGLPGERLRLASRRRRAIGTTTTPCWHFRTSSRSSCRTPCCPDRWTACCRTWRWRAELCTWPPLTSRSPPPA